MSRYTSHQILTDSLVKHAGVADVASAVGGIAPYWVPFLGGILSARDAGRNLLNIKDAFHNRNWRRVLTQGLAASGNGLMAAADYIPVLGSAARGAILTAKNGLKFGKAIKGSTAMGYAAKAALNGGRILKGVDKTTDVGKILHSGIQTLNSGRGYKPLIVNTKKLIDSGKLSPELLKAHKKILSQANKYNAFKGAYSGKKILGNGFHPIATTHGLGANLLTRAPEKLLRGVSRFGKTGVLGTYAGAQSHGGLTYMAGNVPEWLGWSKPKQINPPPPYAAGDEATQALLKYLMNNNNYGQF